MRILPITSNLYTRRVDYDRRKPHLSNSFVQYPNDTFTLSFQANVIASQKEFRRHIAHRPGHHCLYCERELTYESPDFFAWKDGGLFSEPISVITEQLKQYKVSLHDTQAKVFSMLEELAKIKPKTRLDDAINIMSVLANRDLYKIQEPIFDSITAQAKMLPDKERSAVLSIIEISKKRIFRQPYIEEYSGLELRYQIINLTESISDETQKKRIVELAELLMIKSIRKDKKTVTNDVIKKVLETLYPDKEITVTPEMKKEFTREKLRFTIINAIRQEASAANCKDIEKLCDNAEKQLNNEPIIRKFTNKGLMYDLNKALRDIQGTKNNQIKTRILSLASGLPKTDNSVHAFIAKHDESTPEKIAYDIFAPSFTTVEHKIPKSKEGPDKVANYAGACAKCNNGRQDGPMDKYLRRFHSTNEGVRKAVQRNADETIRDANAGYYTYADAKESIRILSEQSKVPIDDSALKDRTPGHG